MNLHNVAHLMKNVKKPDPCIANPVSSHSVQVIVKIVILVRGKNQSWLAPVDKIGTLALVNAALALFRRIPRIVWPEKGIALGQSRVEGRITHVKMASVENVRLTLQIGAKDYYVIQMRPIFSEGGEFVIPFPMYPVG